MASEVKCKSGNYTYLYESISYRNEDGQPRNRREIIGRIDPVTGAKVYKPGYIKRMIERGTPVKISDALAVYSADDIKNSSVKEYGLTFLLRILSERSGLAAALAVASPKYCKQIYAVASHMVACGDPFMYCQEWLSDVDSIEDVGDLSSKKISEILKDISFAERETFYREWCKTRSESEYLALDITSVSSYSELIDDVEWGYNRDNEDLAQINLCMLMGETSRLPIYQTEYSGSLKDVTTLATTMAKFDAIAGEKPILTVMDKGFSSIKNINALLSEDKSLLLRCRFHLPSRKARL